MPSLAVDAFLSALIVIGWFLIRRRWNRSSISRSQKETIFFVWVAGTCIWFIGFGYKNGDLSFIGPVMILLYNVWLVLRTPKQ